MRLNAQQQRIYDLREAREKGFRLAKVGKRLIDIRVAISHLEKPDTMRLPAFEVLGHKQPA